MRRYYRTRFILGAMLAFLILMMLAVAGIWLVSARRMENETDGYIRAVQEQERDENPGFGRDGGFPMFGFGPGMRYPAGYYDILADANGNVLDVDRRGIAEEAEIDVDETVRRILSGNRTGGRAGNFKYSVTTGEDGGLRIILMDISVQLRSLYHLLTSALMVGVLMMAALFLILLPVSAKIASLFMRNTEKQKQFITDAGHDLKTPVAIIRSNTEVMTLLQGKSKWSENILNQTDRLEHLISQLIRTAKLEESREPSRKERTDLGAVIREETQHYLPAMEQKEIRHEIDVPEHFPVRGEEKTLRQLLDLLLDNCVQYADQGGTIRLRAFTDGRKACMEVLNSVEKLPEVEPQQLTERFVRGNTARTQKSGGSGVGLATARRIAEMNRGKLEVRYPEEKQFLVAVTLGAAKQPVSECPSGNIS